VQLPETEIRTIAQRSSTRLQLWEELLGAVSATAVAEVGVFRGRFAEHILTSCPSVERYYLLDPWRHLDDWDKPANKDDDIFEQYYQEVLARTEPYADKRVVLRGTTAEVADEIEDGSLDFVYIDGDHTLRGITVDLLKLYPKVRDGGWIAGDDFCRSIFQHSAEYEPTLVFPYAVYFAEAVGVPIHALPHNQFLLRKDPALGYSFVDLTGRYAATTLKAQLERRRKDPAPAAPAMAVQHRSEPPTLMGRVAAKARRIRAR